MNAALLKVIKADNTNNRAQLQALPQNFHLLENFQFHEEQSVTKVLSAPYLITIDATKALFSIRIPALTARRHIKAPPVPPTSKSSMHKTDNNSSSPSVLNTTKSPNPKQKATPGKA